MSLAEFEMWISEMTACERFWNHIRNESTTGADASVEALKLYHMKLTLGLAYSVLCMHASDSSLPEYKKWEMIAVIVAKRF